jgi:ribosomal protein S18 acetylase RimI-like enzyme
MRDYFILIWGVIRMNYVYTKVELQSSSLHFAITELMKLGIGAPTPEKVKKILAIYEDPNHPLLGCFNEDNLIGLIGLQTKKTHGIITHIAVLNLYQNQGIGKTLITEAISCWKLATCEAETDEDGKGFYEKTGFTCTSFKGPYNMRYQCKWKEGS